MNNVKLFEDYLDEYMKELKLKREKNMIFNEIFRSIEKLVKNDWQSDKVVKMPIDLAWQFKEFDRDKSTFKGEDHIDNLKEDILKNGFKEPIHLRYWGDKVLIIEGNHRLAVAKRLGLEFVPVRIEKYALIGKAKNNAHYLNYELRDFLEARRIIV